MATVSPAQVPTDWDNREFIQNVQYNIMQIAQFLNKFDMSVRGKLATINHRLTHLERQVEYLEASLGGFDQRSLVQSAVAGDDEPES